jgi:uncharacterized membrane protein YeaQ/YmgE (transglycosylase-associated protein family)
MLGLIWTIIIGAIVGALAKMIVPGKDPGGFIVTVLIGIGGALVATYIGRGIGWYEAGQGAGFIASVIGAIVLLLVYRAIKKS